MSSILQDIFSDYYEEMIYTLHPRQSVIENVDKMLHCGDPSYGGAMFGCPHCGNLKFVPFRCKSRFCPSCGNRYNQERSFHMSCKLVACVHRHCVFTIPEELRIYFLKDRSLLDCLFHSVRDVVFRMFSKINKTENFTPGLICVLHTFGRDLKWNPHIHALISEGGAGNITPWRPIKHFDYDFLRIAFRKVLLEQLTARIGPSFRKIKNEMYTKHADGFYVRAKPNLCTPDITIKYISRYLGRPVIALKRIDSYDGENVTFHYNRHEDEKLIVETIPVLEFIQRLIQHIPEKHFKQIRYYGLYARTKEQNKKLQLAISREKHKIILSLNRWRDCTLRSFGYDPLKCPCCGQTMIFLEMYHNHQHISLNEMYERAMAKVHPPSSA